MSRNLRQQARGIIFAAFRENLDKHAMKADDKGERNIFSYTSRNHLLDVINNFCNTVKDNPRNPSELTPRHVRVFLDRKALEGCSQKTLDTYRSDFIKFGKLMGKDLDPGRVMAQAASVTHRSAEDMISHDDLSKIIAYAKSHPSRSGACIQMERLLGIRVGDMAYGMQIEDGFLKIRCKNGKILKRPITYEVEKVLSTKEFLSMIWEDGRIITPKDNSINTYLRRVEDKLGIPRHSFHSIRRRIAQDQYNHYRILGYTRTESLSLVSVWLNHGKNRKKDDFTQIYSKRELSEIGRMAWEDFRNEVKVYVLSPLALGFEIQTGMRIGEICAVKHEDIEGDYIHVQRMYRRDSREIIDHTKTDNGDRIIYLTSEAKRILTAVEEYKLAHGISLNGFLFSVTDRPITERCINDLLKKYCKNMGVLYRSSHSTRKSYGSALIGAGVNINTVRKLLGHADEQTTLKYYCYDQDLDAEKTSKIEEALM